jgi:hypothetical protein
MSGRKTIAAIVGGSMSGKTSLAIGICRRERVRRGLRSLVYDPFRSEHKWGAWAWVTSDIQAFRRAVLGTTGAAVFWDESTTSLKPTTDEDKAFFVNLRHRHSALFLIAHDLNVMSPVMRGSLTDAYVFRQSRSRARDWSELFADESMMASCELSQYEFIHKQPFGPATRHRPTPADIQRL